MEIPAAHGFISPPHLWSTGSYPSELNCEWTLTGGKTKSRGLTVHFSDVEVEQDPRTDPKSMDHIKVVGNLDKYIIYPKYSDTSTPYHTSSKIWTSTIYDSVLCLKIVGYVANSVDPAFCGASPGSALFAQAGMSEYVW